MDSSEVISLVETLDDVQMVTGFVLAYTYLDAEGNPKYGIRLGGEERTIGLLGLTTVAQHHIFLNNFDGEDD